MIKVLSLAVLALALGGCASGRCSGDTSYTKAESIAPIQGTGELQLPDSPAALRVPPLSEAARTAAAQPFDNGGSRRKACLDVPPRLPAVEPEPAPSEPTPAAAAK